MISNDVIKKCDKEMRVGRSTCKEWKRDFEDGSLL